MAQEHNGKFYCQVHPFNITTCQDLKSEEQNVIIIKEPHDHRNKIIEIKLGLLMSASILMIIVAFSGILYCCIQKHRKGDEWKHLLGNTKG